MGALDKIKEVLGKHSDKVDSGLEKAGDIVDEKTGGKHSERIDQGVDKAQEGVQSVTEGEARPPEPGSGERPGA